MMKFQVFKTADGRWRFSNLRNIGGDCDSWSQAFDEAFSIATLTRAEATA